MSIDLLKDLLKPRCPVCSSVLARLKQPPSRYDCLNCKARFRIGAVQATLITLLPPALVAFVLLRYVPEESIPTYLGSFIGSASVAISGALMPRLVRLQHLLDAPPSAPARGQVSLVRALGKERIVPASMHTTALGLIFVSFSLAYDWPDVDYRIVIAIAAMMLLPLVALSDLKCPDCKRWLMFGPLVGWSKMKEMTHCPHCGFAPIPDAELIVAYDRTPASRVGLRIAYGVALFGGIAFAQYAHRPAPVLPSASEPPLYAASFDWSYEDLDGHWHNASDLRGKVVFLTHWATSCRSCRVEMRKIAKLRASMGNQVIFASASKDSRETLRHFADRERLDLPFYRVGEEAPEMLSRAEVPTTYIIDRGGMVRVALTGVANWNDDGVRRYLRSLSEGSDMLLND